jgi:hypothetical protein
MSSAAPPLFIHSLLAGDDTWAGFLVETSARGQVSAENLRQIFEHPLFDQFDKRLRWFVPATPDLQKAPDERVTLIFPSHVGESRTELAQVHQSMRTVHAKVALSVANGDKLPSPGEWDALLISVSQARTLRPFALAGLAGKTAIIGTDVHSHADIAWCRANDCHLSTSEFLLSRGQPGKKADLTRLKLLKLLAMLAEDADTAAIEDVFREESKLAYSLLRLVNSAACAPRSPITCFSQAINLLGRRQLQRWLQLLVYADPNDGQHPNPLLQKAAARGRMMELLSRHLPEPATTIEHLADAAFMIGSFSLLDVLLNLSMQEVLQQLPLPDFVRSALIDHSGPLGELLLMISAAENRDLTSAGSMLLTSGIAAENHLQAQLTAAHWASRIHPNA